MTVSRFSAGIVGGVGKLVFREYDQGALDAEYNNREKVEDSADWIARYAAASAETRAALECRLDLAYGTHPGETLDFFPARERRRRPSTCSCTAATGSGWTSPTSSFVAQALQPAGAAVVVINYALIPTVHMDELVRQCRASIAWVHRNAPSFGGDPNRIYVSGHSAGGHLVAMLMSTDWRAFGGLPTDVIKGGCGISGLYDLEPIRLSYLNEVLKLTQESARRNSPVHCPPQRSSPLLLAVGGLEGPEYHRQTEELAAVWRSRGLPCQVLDMPRHHHFSILAELEDAGSMLSRPASQRPDGASVADFLPFVRRWFDETFAEATRPQLEGWEAIASGRDTLIVAPTGSGKTLAAFLWALDHLHRLGLERRLEDRVYVVYVSPLRALNNDIEKNLRAPLAGIRAAAAAEGLTLPEVRVAVRTGDTLAAQRQAMTRRPPHVLITTPESLYILLTSERFRPALAHTRFLIVDEIHALMGSSAAPTWRCRSSASRRSPRRARAARRPQRIGCSATVSPIESARAFLTGRHRARRGRRSTPASRATSIFKSSRRWTTS